MNKVVNKVVNKVGCKTRKNAWWKEGRMRCEEREECVREEKEGKGRRRKREGRRERSNIPISINNPSTPSPVLALASPNNNPSSSANNSPISLGIFLEFSKSDLLPTSIIIVDGST